MSSADSKLFHTIVVLGLSFASSACGGRDAPVTSTGEPAADTDAAARRDATSSDGAVDADALTLGLGSPTGNDANAEAGLPPCPPGTPHVPDAGCTWPLFL